MIEARNLKKIYPTRHGPVTVLDNRNAAAGAVLPRVAVLLAAYNGMAYIREQVESILAQDGVDVTIFFSVDRSTDGTERWVGELAGRDRRAVLLPYGERAPVGGQRHTGAEMRADAMAGRLEVADGLGHIGRRQQHAQAHAMIAPGAQRRRAEIR